LAHRATRLIPTSVPPGGLTTRLLRKVPLRRGCQFDGLRSLDALCEKIARIRRVQKGAQNKVNALKKVIAERSARRISRRARGWLGEANLVRIAFVYVNALGRGSRKANIDTAESLKLETWQVRDAIHHARRKGLLSATRTQGAGGGELT